MTLPATLRRAGPFAGDNSATAFPFTFKVFAASDVAVWRTNAAEQTDDELTLNADYTVTLNADQDSNPGGTVTYPVSGSPLTPAQELTILSNIPYDQPLDLPGGGAYRPHNVETEFDRIVAQIQQLYERLLRTISVSPSTTGNMQLPPPIPGWLIGWDSNVIPGLTNFDPAFLAAQAALADWRVDYFDGDGVATSFGPLTGNPVVGPNTDVAVDGVVMYPGVDYLYNPTTRMLTFTAPPAAGVENIMARYGQAIQQADVFYASELQTAGAGQSSFTLATFSYTPGGNNLAVYVNGLRMAPGADYTESSATTVTLAAAMTGGEEVLFIGGEDLTGGGSGGGGGGSDPALGGVTIPDFTMDDLSPASRRWEFPNTAPNGWNLGAGTQTVAFDFMLNDYIAANPGGHIAFGLRCDTDVIAVQTRFHGPVLGDLTGASEGCPHEPAFQLETAAVGLAPAGIRHLFPNSWTAKARPIEDGVQYSLQIDSTNAYDGRRYIRYRLWRKNSDPVKQAWDLERDTGDVRDHNVWLDMSKSGFVIGSVFESNLVPWSVDITNASVTWGPPKWAATDLMADEFDGNLYGDLNFSGDGRRITIKCNGATPNDYTMVQSRDVNTLTQLLAIPNGTGTAATVGGANKSDLSVAAAAASFGMNGARAQIDVFGMNGHAQPPLDIKVGATHTFDSVGLLIAGGTEKIGLTSTRLLGPTNLEGGDIDAFVGAFDYLNTATIGNIAAFIGGAYNAGNLENIIRPLYCHLAQLINDLRRRKVI